MTFPAAPFAPVPMLVVSPADSDLRRVAGEMHELVVWCPGILTDIDRDLDAHGLRKKAVRIADKRWKEARSLPLSGVDPGLPTDGTVLKLAQGRPRSPAYAVFMALMLRGYLGEGFKACGAATMMLESSTLAVVFENLGVACPRSSTLTELVNAVTNATRQRILDEQIAMVLHLGWDDFGVMLQDSTHVEGNSAWPTDGHLMVALIERMLRVGASLWRLGLPEVKLPGVHRLLDAMAILDRTISMARGTRKAVRTRRKCYAKLLRRADRAHTTLCATVTEIESALANLDILPSRLAMATRVVRLMRADVTGLQTVIANCKARVIEEKTIPMANKKLSTSDPDVGFIAKGQRVPVIGYKPQVARSGAGFITGLILPQGNASDSGQLVPMVDEVIRRTRKVPRVVSVDDGYASRANVDAIRLRGIAVVSISGSKGKALTAADDWNSSTYVDARGLRSAIESLMFTLKQGFNFGEVARRGLDAVHGEMLEKALACNLCHMARMRRARSTQEDTPRAAAA